MDIAIQILATFGPLILVVMGAIVSVRPPKQDGHGHWYWLAAFLVIGLPISFASFFELRSSDTLQGEIHEDVRQLLKKSPTTNEDWPSLSDTEKSQLISAIRLLPPQSITVACETEKCKKVSDDLCDALHYGGWNVTKLHGGGFGVTGTIGVTLNPIEANTMQLKEAIEKTTHLKVNVGPDKRNQYYGDGPEFLVVGTKPF